MFNDSQYNTSVLTSAFLFTLGCLTQGLIYNDIFFIKFFSMCLVMTFPICFKFYRARQKNAKSFRMLLSLSAAAVILGAVFNSGLVSSAFGFTGIWVTSLLFEKGSD
ncbi:MAG: hypothetical protein ACI86X_001283 [Moritella sp.]|jgi:hypothetical protein